MNTIGNMGAAFILYAFAFLESEPYFKCQKNPPSTDWTYGAGLDHLQDEYCSNNYVCEIDWSNPESFHNIIVQLDFYCAPGWQIGLIGAIFLIGIVVGCATLTRLGDVYGRRPIYMAGLLLHLVVMVVVMISKNVWVDYVFLFLLGLSVTMRYYVGYTFNVEMQPKHTAVIVSTI